MRVRDVATDIPAAPSYVSYVDDAMSGLEVLAGRRAMFIVPCATAADVQRAKDGAAALPGAWGIRVRVDRPEPLPDYEYFVITLAQLELIVAQTPTVSEGAMAIVGELMEAHGRFMSAVAFAADHPNDADVGAFIGCSAPADVLGELGTLLRNFADACEPADLARFRRDQLLDAS